MENFTYHNPTRLHFGRGQIAALDRELPAAAHVLLLAGGGSIRGNGVYDQVQRALGGRIVHECRGVEPNPDFDMLRRAVGLIRRDRRDWVLPVGGGSALEGAKFVAAAEVARRLTARGAIRLGERGDVSPAKVEEILRRAACRHGGAVRLARIGRAGRCRAQSSPSRSTARNTRKIFPAALRRAAASLAECVEKVEFSEGGALSPPWSCKRR